MITEIQPEMKYKNIFREKKKIWLDNGMINRLEPLDDKCKKLSTWLSNNYHRLDLLHIEDMLNLDDENLEIVCCGEESEANNLLDCEKTLSFLDLIFEEMYLNENGA